jgi:hypothetical protein
LSSSYLIFYSSKEAVIFSEYKALILSSISSRMAATSLLGASLPSLTRQPSSRPSSVITTLLIGLVGSSPTLYSITFIYTFFLVHALCTLNLGSSYTYPSSVLALCRPARCWCHTSGCWNCFSRTTFAAHHFSLPRRCRADIIHGCIHPCIIRN